MLSVLANRTYRHLFLAQVIALIGTGLATVALGLLAYDIAGGNAGAVLGGFILKSEAYNSNWDQAFLHIGMGVTCFAFLALLIRFSPEKEAEEKALFEKAQIGVLKAKADEAAAALAHSAEIIETYNKTHENKV